MNESTIHDYLKAKGLNEYGISGLMGNLFAESGLNPRNLQNSYETVLGMNDNAYVTSVDNGTYTNFVRDKAGFGIAQWTYWSRKQSLINFARASGKSIGDLLMQLDFLWKELSESYPGVLAVLRSATSVLEASNAVLLNYEKPANQSVGVQKRRAEYGQKYYNQFAAKAVTEGGQNMGYSNSGLVSCTKISPNKNSPRNHTIDRITIHCVVGQCTAERIGEIFQNKNRKASCNYGIGKDGRIILVVDEKDRSWCSSSAANDNRAITFEVASDTTHPYAVTDAALQSAINLCEDICRRYGKKKLLWFGDKEKTLSYTPAPDEMVMTVHRWFAAKACPGDYLYNRHSMIAEEVTRRLNMDDKNKEDDDMDVARFKELWSEMRKELQDNDCGTWSKDAREWAVSTGLIAGNGTTIDGEPNCMWADMLTREQFVAVLYRFAQLMGNV